MADSDYAEFSIAHDRLYTLDHLWMQVLDEDKEEGTTSIKIGLSEFLMAEYGEVIQIVLARPRDESDFEIDADSGLSEDDEEEDKPPKSDTMGAQVDTDELLITVTTRYDGEFDRMLINAPISCTIVELNGHVEDNPDLANEDAYGDAWCVIVKTFTDEFDEDQFMDKDEYLAMLNELP